MRSVWLTTIDRLARRRVGVLEDSAPGAGSRTHRLEVAGAHADVLRDHRLSGARRWTSFDAVGMPPARLRAPAIVDGADRLDARAAGGPIRAAPCRTARPWSSPGTLAPDSWIVVVTTLSATMPVGARIIRHDAAHEQRRRDQDGARQRHFGNDERPADSPAADAGRRSRAVLQRFGRRRARGDERRDQAEQQRRHRDNCRARSASSGRSIVTCSSRGTRAGRTRNGGFQQRQRRRGRQPRSRPRRAAGFRRASGGPAAAARRPARRERPSRAPAQSRAPAAGRRRSGTRSAAPARRRRAARRAPAGSSRACRRAAEPAREPAAIGRDVVLAEPRADLPPAPAPPAPSSTPGWSRATASMKCAPRLWRVRSHCSRSHRSTSSGKLNLGGMTPAIVYCPPLTLSGPAHDVGVGVVVLPPQPIADHGDVVLRVERSARGKSRPERGGNAEQLEQVGAGFDRALTRIGSVPGSARLISGRHQAAASTNAAPCGPVVHEVDRGEPFARQRLLRVALPDRDQFLRDGETAAAAAAPCRRC